MNSFDNKEKAEENRYAHDKEVQFLINARYHKLLALWVAEKSGLDAEETQQYKTAFISETVGKNEAETIFAKVKHDLLMNKLHLEEQEIREAMYTISQEAKKQVMEKE